MVCSNPDDCAEIERRHAGDGLLRNGGASEETSSPARPTVLLTASPRSEEKANPGYRAFFANGFNVTRSLALVGWKSCSRLVAASRQRRRDVLPRGHRSGIYPAAPCRHVRRRPGPHRVRRADRPLHRAACDLRDVRRLRRGCAPLRARAARHAGGAQKARRAVRPDREALRYAPRPYHVVVLSDHGQTQGDVQAAQQLQARGSRARVHRDWHGARRRGRGREPDERRRRLRRGHGAGDESGEKRSPKKDVSGQDVVVLGSGNLGLIYLMEEPRRLTVEEIEERHPRLIPALDRTRTSASCSPTRQWTAPWCSARTASSTSPTIGSPETIPSGRTRTRPRCTWRTDGFAHAPDLLVRLLRRRARRGCAFEADLVPRGHGRAPDASLHPRSVELSLPERKIIGAAHVQLLKAWRYRLRGARTIGRPCFSSSASPCCSRFPDHGTSSRLAPAWSASRARSGSGIGASGAGTRRPACRRWWSHGNRDAQAAGLAVQVRVAGEVWEARCDAGADPR